MGVTIEDLLAYRFLSGVRWSPDGRWIACHVKRANRERNAYDGDLYVLSLHDGRLRQLTASGREGAFVWSADSAAILFISKREDADDEAEGSALYRIPVDGGEAQRLARIEHTVERLERIDDQRLLYTARIPRENAKTEDTDTGDYEVLEEIPYWQNGKGFTSGRRVHLFAFDPERSASRELLGGDLEVMDVDCAHGRIAAIARRFEGVAPITSELWLVDAGGGDARCLSRGELQLDAVRFRTPDELVVLGTTGDRFGLGQSRELLRFGLDGEGGSAWAPAWERMPGNRVAVDCRGGAGATLRCAEGAIYAVVTEGGSSYLDRLDEGGELQRLIDAAGSVDDFDVGPAGVAFIALREGRLQELYLHDGAGERRLTSLNDAALDGRAIIAPEAFTATHEDGTRIEAWLLRPVGLPAGARCPAILEIHGGPKAAYGTAFMHEFQALAAAGYAVIYSNPRGSAGRGDAYADLRGRYGTIDYEDLMAVVDEALRRFPFLDPDRLGVAGGSYGGFMANWIIGHTDRFRAAASQRSISNWVSKTCTTDIGYYFNVDQIGTTPWADDGAETMWWHSPLRYADRASTPTLLIHSEQDYRCWLDQGLQMFTALRYHGVEARLVLFKGENHELSRSGKPLHRMRRLREILDWFDRFLDGSSASGDDEALPGDDPRG
jgi:dipeptidyl aminopeptidase/acylaminoacyl peptidase